LEPTEVERYWDLIQEVIRDSVPDHACLRNEVILGNLLNGRMQCWMLCAPLQATVVRALALTALIEDPSSGTKDCLMYAASAFVPVTDAVWKAAQEDLVVFARANGCDQITCFTKDKRILGLLDGMGYNTEYRFCSLELKGA